MSARVVWKVELVSTRGPVQTHELPTPFEVVHVEAVETGFERIAVWFLCDPTATFEAVTFKVRETGAAVPEDRQGEESIYVGTAVFAMHSLAAPRPYVLHVFRDPTDLEPSWGSDS